MTSIAPPEANQLIGKKCMIRRLGKWYSRKRCPIPIKMQLLRQLNCGR